MRQSSRAFASAPVLQLARASDPPTDCPCRLARSPRRFVGLPPPKTFSTTTASTRSNPPAPPPPAIKPVVRRPLRPRMSETCEGSSCAPSLKVIACLRCSTPGSAPQVVSHKVGSDCHRYGLRLQRILPRGCCLGRPQGKTREPAARLGMRVLWQGSPNVYAFSWRTARWH